MELYNVLKPGEEREKANATLNGVQRGYELSLDKLYSEFPDLREHRQAVNRERMDRGKKRYK